MRLNRFLAAAGFGSRRGCEELIRAGRVTINGQPCLDLATEVREEDAVKVNGRRAVAERKLYALLHKPAGYLCTASDEKDRRTIFDLLPRSWPRVYHVGRLDKESEGLLILTNDGELALHLTHPRYKIEKEYEILLNRPFDLADREKLLKGVRIEGGRAVAESVRQLAPLVLRIVLKQGLKRQIRHMLYALDYEVEELIRIRIGALELEDLPRGAWRFLTSKEVAVLMASPVDSAAKKPRAGHRSNIRRSSP